MQAYAVDVEVPSARDEGTEVTDVRGMLGMDRVTPRVRHSAQSATRLWWRKSWDPVSAEGVLEPLPALRRGADGGGERGARPLDGERVGMPGRSPGR